MLWPLIVTWNQQLIVFSTCQLGVLITSRPGILWRIFIVVVIIITPLVVLADSKDRITIKALSRRYDGLLWLWRRQR